MENHKNLIILIVPFLLREISILRRLFEDLRNEEFSILPLPPVRLSPFWLRIGDPFWLNELDIDKWEYFLHHWWRHYLYWREFYPELREEFSQMLKEASVRGKPRQVVLLAPSPEESVFDFELFQDIVRAVQPAAIVDLRIGEAPPLLAERMPDHLDFPSLICDTGGKYSNKVLLSKFH